MLPGRLTRALCEILDRAAKVLRRQKRQPAHLETGRRGEDLAHFRLRELGYTIVARNWRTPRRRGELDLVAWDDGVLCFVEVKTRTSREVKPAEAAVDRAKRREIEAMAREYLRRLRLAASIRFDVISVYFEPGREPACQVFKNAYSWRTMKPGGSFRF
jgi:putative endonuclease